MRKSSIFIIVTAVNILLIGLLTVHARYSQAMAATALRERAEMVRTLQLTDLCLFTEARYTRNPAMADRFAPFQDHPGAMEHFPSGSLVTPPSKRIHEFSP
ncbi:MAG: hypothetical protein M0023_14455 [Desulfobacteraceae bacterium]|nr:hypothetical protein [Desulfobacteraceae bacterium]